MLISPRLLLLTSFLLFGVTTTARADDITLETSVELKKLKKDSPRATEGGLNTVPFAVWLPEGVTTVRGLVFNPFYTQCITQQHWRGAARQWQFGILGGNFFGVNNDEFPTVIDEALAHFAEKSGHKEIAQAKMCVVGMSAGAGMCTQIAERMPERVIAAGLVCLEVGPRNAASMNIPMLAIFGERDGKQYELLKAKLPEVRAEHGLYAIAIQWKRKHEYFRANNLVVPFFDAVIAQRLVDLAKPLANIDESSGWLGEMQDWDNATTVASFVDYKGDRTKACWFPNATIAHAWQAFVTKDEALQINAPVGVGDGKAIRVYPLGQAIEVKGGTKDKAQDQEPIDVYSGARKVGTLSDGSAIVTFDKPGFYPIYLQSKRPDGRVQRSRSSTIIVGAKP